PGTLTTSVCWLPSRFIDHTCRSPTWSVTKTMRSPVGENRGSVLFGGPAVRADLADPSGAMTQTWTLALELPQAICEPSGDQAGFCTCGIGGMLRLEIRAPETFQVTTTVPPSSTVAASVWPSG